MKDNMFEVVMYLFESYAESDSEFCTDQASMTVRLRQAGFLNSEIDKAFEWLEGLVSLEEKTLPHAIPNKLSMRVFSQQEQIKLNLECRGYLLLLEQVDIVNEIARELIIDRCMALETDNFNLDHFKWVILLVLFNLDDSSLWMKNIWVEDLIQKPAPHAVH